MKGIILYESKNGATKEYAEWLAQDTGFECRPAKKAGKLAAYDLVVMGSCVRMYKVSLGPWIAKKWDKLKGKKLALFTVAGAPKGSADREKALAAAVTPEIKAALPHFPLDGRMKFDSMRWIDRKLMALGIKMAAKRNPEEARKMSMEFDKVDRAGLKPLAEYIKSLG
jgi:menaquinone-dependent protoporphyrinogen IX oxidase